ncbi:MAG: hypothetical protein AB7G13_26865 [Lautropia sp.]
MSSVETRLHAFAQRVAALRRAPTAGAPARAAIRTFQRDRLVRTHGDLLQTERYRLAARFFLDELYGTKDFSERDAELARIIPTMTRLLPSSVLVAIADAIELDAISEELDDALAARWQAEAADPAALPSDADYCGLYRAVGRFDARRRQIELVAGIGRDLDRLVGKPLLFRILKSMDRPARLAGLHRMQAFLVDGFTAFRAMHGADAFIQTIVVRETALMDAIAGGADSVALPVAALADGSRSASRTS